MIAEARGERDLLDARALFERYARWFEQEIGIDFGFQSFDRELVDLGAVYARPAGNLWVAREATGAPIGTVAVKALSSEGDCEMKRLFVSPSVRGGGLGRRLAETAIGWAREAGYREMKLDTLARMEGAVALYRALGFRTIDPYVHNPIPDVVFLGLRL